MSRKRRVWTAVAAVIVVTGAFGLYWFQPWKLFIDHRVDETLPPAATEPVAVAAADSTLPAAPAASSSPATARLVSRGTLISHEHDTKGTVSVIRQADGRLVLTLAGLDTSDGPDVHVWLSDQKVKKGDWYNFGRGRHVDLGSLKGNQGNQVYRIPTGTVLARYPSVTIWCERFDVSFGAATLAPVG